MLLNPSALEEQLSHPVEDAVREAYLAFAHARVPEEMTFVQQGMGTSRGSCDLRRMARGCFLLC